MKPYYSDGRVTIYHGDCFSVMREMASGSVDAIVTDPPFKLSQEYGSGADADNLLAVSSIWPVAREMWRLAKPGACCAMFYDTRILPLALAAMQGAEWKYLRALTFYRRWGSAFNCHGWMSTSDFVLLFVKPGAKPRFYGKCQHDVYTKAGPEAESTGHPAQKPLEFVRHIVENICPPGGTLLDPYLGSGTTALAANSRHFIGIEKDETYCEMAARRMDQFALNLPEVA